MLIDNEDYPIENPKYYLVVLDIDGSMSELIFTRKAILDYLKKVSDNPFDVGMIETLIELQEEQITLILNLHNGESKKFI